MRCVFFLHFLFCFEGQWHTVTLYNINVTSEQPIHCIPLLLHPLTHIHILISTIHCFCVFCLFWQHFPLFCSIVFLISFFFFSLKRKVGLWGNVHSPVSVTNDWPQACRVRKWWETWASFTGVVEEEEGERVSIQLTWSDLFIIWLEWLGECQGCEISWSIGQNQTSLMIGSPSE